MTWILPFHVGAPGGRLGKDSMRGPFAGTLLASSCRVVLTLWRIGAGSGRSPGVEVYQAPPSLLSSWLPFGVLYSRRAEFWTSMFSRKSIGKMFSSWWRGSRGVVRKVPEINLTASFWTTWSFLTSVTCFPVNHSWHPYVRTGKHMA